MKRLAATLAMTALLAVVPPPAQAATGRVVVFSTEFTPVKVYEDPNGCNKLPSDSHVLVNLTGAKVVVHGDPLCLSPGPVVEPEYGSHVSGSGSFSVKD
jgi:hypothetical protein